MDTEGKGVLPFLHVKVENQTAKVTKHQCTEYRKLTNTGLLSKLYFNLYSFSEERNYKIPFTFHNWKRAEHIFI